MISINASSNWHLECGQGVYRLKPRKPQKKGWFVLDISYTGNISPLVNPVVKLFLATGEPARTLPLIIHADRLRVIFLAPEPLTLLEVQQADALQTAASLRFRLYRRAEFVALASMMWAVSRRDARKGISPIRVYAKSRARYKKHGFSGYLTRLFKEYYLVDTHRLEEADIYQSYIAKTEHRSQDSIQSTLTSLSYQPVISVIMATWQSDLRWLDAAIQSVLHQSYPYWQLCIADDASEQKKLIELLNHYKKKDSRIRVTFRYENGHICAAQNSALALATGAYVTFLDHDDLLAPNALLAVAEALQQQPRPLFLYSDEDKIDGTGRRVNPHFKSDWNPDLLCAQNYITHLMVVERALVESVGGFRVGVEGSQDHDLALRVTEKLPPAFIHHIPQVLYHWRITENSTALHADAKNYTSSAGVAAIEEHFKRKKQDDVMVQPGLLPNTYRVLHPIPKPAPLVTLLIPTRDRLDMLKPCISSIIEKTNYKPYEIIILDNGSSEPQTHHFFAEIQAQHEHIRVLSYDKPFNYSAINNFGVAHAQGAIIGLINNDIEVIQSGWLTELVSHAVRPEIGCVGAKLYFDDGSIQHAGVILGIGGVAGHAHKYFARDAHGYFSRLQLVQNLSAVTGACLLVRKEVFEQVGGLEEEHLTVAFNDIDLCLKVREAGYRNLWTPHAELYHHESKSRGRDDAPEKQARFQREVAWMKARWGVQLNSDPYYNPNLTLQHEDFSIRLHE